MTDHDSKLHRRFLLATWPCCLCAVREPIMIVQGPGLLQVSLCVLCKAIAHSSSLEIRTLKRRLDAYVDSLTSERMLVYLLYKGVLTAAPYCLVSHYCAAA